MPVYRRLRIEGGNPSWGAAAWECNVGVVRHDAPYHLTGVSGAVSATFVYDGDGNRVKGTVNGSTTVYIGSHFEWVVQEKHLHHCKAMRAAPRR